MTDKKSILFPYMPKEEYLHPAWCGCLHWAIGNEEIVSKFREETGIKWEPAKNVIDRMIDQSTGIDNEFICAFAKWMNENIWGMDGKNDRQKEHIRTGAA